MRVFMATVASLALATGLASAGMAPDTGPLSGTTPEAIHPPSPPAPTPTNATASIAAPAVAAPAVAAPAVPAVDPAPSPSEHVEPGPQVPAPAVVISVPVHGGEETDPTAVPSVAAVESGAAKAPAHRMAIAFMGGQCDKRARVALLAIDFFSGWEWGRAGKWYQTPYLELLGAYWHGHPGWTKVDTLKEVGLTAVVRTVRYPTGSATPYLDLGLGVDYLTEDRIENKLFGSDVLFSSNAGIGILFGQSKRFDLGLRARHLSNAGTKQINWGINFYMFRIAINL